MSFDKVEWQSIDTCLAIFTTAHYIYSFSCLILANSYEWPMKETGPQTCEHFIGTPRLKLIIIIQHAWEPKNVAYKEILSHLAIINLGSILSLSDASMNSPFNILKCHKNTLYTSRTYIMAIIVQWIQENKETSLKANGNWSKWHYSLFAKMPSIFVSIKMFDEPMLEGCLHGKNLIITNYEVWISLSHQLNIPPCYK